MPSHVLVGLGLGWIAPIAAARPLPPHLSFKRCSQPLKARSAAICGCEKKPHKLRLGSDLPGAVSGLHDLCYAHAAASEINPLPPAQSLSSESSSDHVSKATSGRRAFTTQAKRSVFMAVSTSHHNRPSETPRAWYSKHLAGHVARCRHLKRRLSQSASNGR